MTEIDPVILRLIADTKKYQADLKAATRTVDQQLGTQQKRVRMLEKQFSQSSGQISTTIKRLAGTLAAAFSARELIGLMDSFTRFENRLKVVGYEGERLADTKERLAAVANKYGVSLESVGTLFGRNAASAKELNLSLEDQFTIVEATSAALKVNGTSSSEARGALLQLSQAFGGAKIQTTEYNSLIDGARPLLQAVADGSDRWAGSVSKLTADVRASNVATTDFVQALLKGSGGVIKQAEGAVLTLAGAFTVLENKMIDYVGGASSAYGATALLTDGIEGLADNLDDIIPALAVIGVGLGVGFATNAARARLAAIALSTGATGASVSLGTLAVAARGAGAALLGAFGGPIGLAITAVALGLIYVASESAKTTKALNDQGRAADTAAKFNQDLQNILNADPSDKTAGSVRNLASAHREAARAAYEHAAAEIAAQRAQGQKALRLARSGKREVTTTHYERVGKTRARKAVQVTELVPYKKLRRVRGGDANQPQAKAERAAEELIAGADSDGKALRGAYAEALRGAPSSAPAGASGKPNSRKSTSPRTRASSASSGPSPAEIASRHADDLNRLQQEEIQAKIQITDDAKKRASLASDLLVLEFSNRKKQIDESADLNGTQKAAQIAILEKLYGIETKYNDQNEIVLSANNALYQQAIERDRAAQTERDAADLADERYRAEDEQLRLQFDLADTQAERRDIALKILAAEDRFLRSKLEAIIASDAAVKIEKQRAQIALDSLNATAGARQESVTRSNEGALARYARGTKDVDARIEEITVRKIQDINDTIANTLADELGIKDKFIRDLLTVFLDKAIFGPLADSLSGAGGGGGLDFGNIISGIGAIFGGGRASGGPVTGGKVYRVNEGSGAGRVEGFAPTGSGKIIPLGQMNAMQQSRGSGGGVVTVRLALSGDIEATIDQRSAAVAVEVTRAAAPEIVKASVSETFRQGGRQPL